MTIDPGIHIAQTIHDQQNHKIAMNSFIAKYGNRPIDPVEAAAWDHDLSIWMAAMDHALDAL